MVGIATTQYLVAAIFTYKIFGLFLKEPAHLLFNHRLKKRKRYIRTPATTMRIISVRIKPIMLRHNFLFLAFIVSTTASDIEKPRKPKIVSIIVSMIIDLIFWCTHQELNLEPCGPKPHALSVELWVRKIKFNTTFPFEQGVSG